MRIFNIALLQDFFIQLHPYWFLIISEIFWSHIWNASEHLYLLLPVPGTLFLTMLCDSFLISFNYPSTYSLLGGSFFMAQHKTAIPFQPILFTQFGFLSTTHLHEEYLACTFLATFIFLPLKYNFHQCKDFDTNK